MKSLSSFFKQEKKLFTYSSIEMRKVIILGLIVIMAISLGYFYTTQKKKNIDTLNLVIWVWERPENLYFMKSENVTYAFLAGTATKTDNDLVFYPRKQPLRIPDNNKTIAVVRIEDKSIDKSLIDAEMEQISDFVVNSCTKLQNNTGCQIDFDAGESQLDFYKRLLESIRIKLPVNMKLSITSLVSWCTTSKPWFAESQIDEAIPMFFRLGKDSNIYWRKITEGTLELNSMCQKSVGISTDEEMPNKVYIKNKIIYIFNNKYWDRSNWNIIKSGVENKLNEN